MVFSCMAFSSKRLTMRGAANVIGKIGKRELVVAFRFLKEFLRNDLMYHFLRKIFVFYGELQVGMGDRDIFCGGGDLQGTCCQKIGFVKNGSLISKSS